MNSRSRVENENKILYRDLISVKPLSLSQFIDMAEKDPGFSFARISDGGFFCIMGRKGVNCDGAAYSPEQAAALIAMMKDTTITHGITSIALNVTKAAEWLIEHRMEVDWYDADVMNKASDDGKLLPFIEFLRGHNSLLVGASHLRNLRGFPIVSFVECHPTRAFEEVDALQDEIAYRIETSDPTVVLLCAGQGASPTLVSRLHSEYPNVRIIDAGSLFDPYVGVLSRSGHKKRGLEWYKRFYKINFGS
jgi:hypothetical protein